MPHSLIPFDPDLVDDNQGYSLIIPDAIFTTLIIISTGTRIISRLRTKTKFGMDNYMITIGLAFNLIANTGEFIFVHQGFGRHLQFLTEEQGRTIWKLGQCNIIFAVIALWAVKISICFFILTLIRDAYHRTVYVVYGLMAVTTLTTLGSVVQSIVWSTQEMPLQNFWDSDIPGTMGKPDILVITISIFTAIFSVTDLFYAVSPIYFFGRLQLDLRRKLVLLGLTGSGLVVFAISIARVAYVRRFFDPDFTWALPKFYLLTLIERNLAQLIADLPALYPLIRDLYRRLRESAKRLRLPGSTITTQGGGEAQHDHHSDFRNDSQCAIVTVGSNDIRPIELREVRENGKYDHMSITYESHVEQEV